MQLYTRRSLRVRCPRSAAFWSAILYAILAMFSAVGSKPRVLCSSEYENAAASAVYRAYSMLTGTYLPQMVARHSTTSRASSRSSFRS